MNASRFSFWRCNGSYIGEELGVGDRKSRLVSGSISRSRSSGCRVLPCVNVTIICEPGCELIDEEVNRSERWAGEKAGEAAPCTGRMRNEQHGEAYRRGRTVWTVILSAAASVLLSAGGDVPTFSVCDMYCKEIEDEHRVCISQREGRGRARRAR